MELGDRKLVVQRASVGAKQGLDIPVGLPLSFVPLVVKDEEATRVLQLMNMVTPEELEDDEEYQGNAKCINLSTSILTKHADIWDDIAEECGKFGTVIDMKIPRSQSGQNVPGLGKVILQAKLCKCEILMPFTRSLSDTKVQTKLWLAYEPLQVANLPIERWSRRSSMKITTLLMLFRTISLILKNDYK